METAEKMLTRQVFAALRLQAVAHGLLARRRVGRLLDMQLFQSPHPVTVPSGCLSPCKGGDHGSATSGGVAAAVRGFLARRRLQKVHTQMRDRKAALAAVTFAFDAEGCDLDSLNGYQQLCRSAAMFKGAYSNSAGMVVGEVCSSLSPMGTHYLAPQLSVYDHREDVSVGLCRDCFKVAMLLRSSRSDGLHGIHVVVHMQHHHADGKSLSLFQIKNNQIS
jgi:hypothetical protein